MIDQSEPLSPELAVRLLRAKASDLEAHLATAQRPEPIDWLAADVALIATLVADHIERTP